MKTHFRLNTEEGYWAVSCRPALAQLRPKKEPKVSDRDTNGLVDRESFHV